MMMSVLWFSSLVQILDVNAPACAHPKLSQGQAWPGLWGQWPHWKDLRWGKKKPCGTCSSICALQVESIANIVWICWSMWLHTFRCNNGLFFFFFWCEGVVFFQTCLATFFWFLIGDVGKHFRENSWKMSLRSIPLDSFFNFLTEINFWKTCSWLNLILFTFKVDIDVFLDWIVFVFLNQYYD